MKTIQIISATRKIFVLMAICCFLFTNNAKAQNEKKFKADLNGNTYLFENANGDGKIGLSATSPYTPFSPDANFHVRLQSASLPANPLVKLDVYQIPRDYGSLSFLYTENNNSFALNQTGRNLINHFEGNVLVGDLVFSSIFSTGGYKFAIIGDGLFNGKVLVNGNINMKDTLTFIHSDSHKSGILWQTIDKDDVFFFTNHNIRTDSYTYPLSFDPMLGVITHGLLQADSIRILKGAGANKVLISDQYGNGIWTDASLFHDDDWLPIATTTDAIMPYNLYLNESKYTNVGIGTNSPLQKLHVVDGNILLSRRPTENQVSLNGSILFGEQPTLAWPNGEWGIEYFNDGLNFWKVASATNSGANYCLFLKNDGNVGIGTELPQSKFQVNSGFEKFSVGSANFSGLGTGTSYMGFNLVRNKSGWLISSNGTHNGGALSFGDVRGNYYFVTVPSDTTGSEPQLIGDSAIANHIRMTITKDGDVGIGTNNTHSYKLAVKGKILCENLKVQLEESWPDYVFYKDYKLSSLKEVENYIIENNHLPGIPSASEIKQNGVDVGQMNIKLLQKVEELTRYLIDQQKQIEEQKRQIDELTKSIKSR
ncbi:MAG: hypothetical protein M0P47_12620 [Bacteroidales bacterium]|nr:hypothetical protein [Bacteroidales bacterium]